MALELPLVLSSGVREPLSVVAVPVVGAGEPVPEVVVELDPDPPEDPPSERSEPPPDV